MKLREPGLPPRLSRLADESHLDFVQAFKNKVLRDMYPLIWREGDAAVARSRGDSQEEPSLAEVQAILRRVPVVPTSQRFWRTSQEMMWRRTRASVLRHEGAWLSALQGAEARGPGRLVYDPAFEVPAYARHEIHLQPGGYTDDPLGGIVFHLGTRVFYLGDNDHDEIHREIVDAVAVPADGVRARMLDIGCSIGQATMALAERFPGSEVWGVDVALPLLRYAHWCAVQRRLAVNFAQGLAERLPFPDGHFDAVLSYILFHEVPYEVTQRIVPEIARVMRPGGTFTVFDFPNRGPGLTAASRFMVDYDSHDNCEPYSQEFVRGDFHSLLEKAGFDVHPGRKLSTNSFLQSLVAIRR